MPRPCTTIIVRTGRFLTAWERACSVTKPSSDNRPVGGIAGCALDDRGAVSPALDRSLRVSFLADNQKNNSAHAVQGALSGHYGAYVRGLSHRREPGPYA